MNFGMSAQQQAREIETERIIYHHLPIPSRYGRGISQYLVDFSGFHVGKHTVQGCVVFQTENVSIFFGGGSSLDLYHHILTIIRLQYIGQMTRWWFQMFFSFHPLS